MSHTEYFCNGQIMYGTEHDNTSMFPCKCGKKFTCPVCGKIAGTDSCNCESESIPRMKENFTRMKKHFTPEPLSGSLSPDHEDFNL